MPPMTEPTFDIVIAGGGPAGLSAALTFGRARKRVLLCDAGPRRNAAATHIHTFVTRDGTPPDEFRRVAREQVRAYPSVAVHDTPVTTITGQKDAFAVTFGDDRVHARRVLLCTGLIDILPDIDGLRELWGGSVFQCPYCHGWEVRDRRFAYLSLDRPPEEASWVPTDEDRIAALMALAKKLIQTAPEYGFTADFGYPAKATPATASSFRQQMQEMSRFLAEVRAVRAMPDPGGAAVALRDRYARAAATIARSRRRRFIARLRSR